MIRFVTLAAVAATVALRVAFGNLRHRLDAANCARPIGAAAFCALAASCADASARNEATRLANEIRALFAVEGEIVQYDARPDTVPPGMSATEFEQQQWPPFADECLRSRAASMAVLVEQLGAAAQVDRERAVAYGVAQSAQLDAATAACGASYGLIVSARLQLRDGRLTDLGDILRQADQLARRRERVLAVYAASLEESEDFWHSVGIAFAAVAAGMAQTVAVNPSQIWVAPYVRADGTFVTPHRRTTPNSTCADNIRGC